MTFVFSEAQPDRTYHRNIVNRNFSNLTLQSKNLTPVLSMEVEQEEECI